MHVEIEFQSYLLRGQPSLWVPQKLFLLVIHNFERAFALTQNAVVKTRKSNKVF